MKRTVLAGLVSVLCVPAMASVTVTQGTSAPTYSTQLTFDEPGGPLGDVADTSWDAMGISQLTGGAGLQRVEAFNTNPGFGWCGTGNAAYLPWGAFISFSGDVTGFSTRYWDSSGPADIMSGGAIVVALKDGAEVGSLFLTDPAYGGVGDEWINIVASGGSSFDEVRLVGFGFFPEAYLDNLSWDAVPAPSAGTLALVGALAAGRRRR